MNPDYASINDASLTECIPNNQDYEFETVSDEEDDLTKTSKTEDPARTFTSYVRLLKSKKICISHN